MPKLAQVLAIEKGEKAKSNKAVSELHHNSAKPALYEGRVRTYEPADEEGEQLPPERQLVQLHGPAVMEELNRSLAEYWDIVAVKDWTNAYDSRADVVVDGTTLVSGAPVSWLLFMEKQLVDVETFISKLPTLDASERWVWDSNQNCYVTETTWQNRTRKTPRNHVKFDGDEHHPPQVEVYTEDVVVGRFKNTRHSGALPVEMKEKLIERVRKLRKAVLFAREQANSVEAHNVSVAETVFGFLMEPVKSGAVG